MDDGGDLELAEGLAAGDVEALARLYDSYGALAYSVALRVLGDPGRAEDVVQDCFLKLWNNAERFDERRGSLRTWLITAVRNRSIDYLRGRGAHERQEREIPLDAEATGPGSDPWHEVATAIERDVIREALASLPGEQRQAVELAYFGGYSHREIAEMIRVPLSTVKGRMRLALEKLHSYLQARGLVYDL
jgi:RNA polymerase sigma-70 factor (ECF subfamily)